MQSKPRNVLRNMKIDEVEAEHPFGCSAVNKNLYLGSLSRIVGTIFFHRTLAVFSKGVAKKTAAHENIPLEGNILVSQQEIKV